MIPDHCPTCQNHLHQPHKNSWFECPTCPKIFFPRENTYLPRVRWNPYMPQYIIALPHDPITLTSTLLQAINITSKSPELMIIKLTPNVALKPSIKIPLTSNQPLYLLSNQEIIELINTLLIFA